MAIQETWKISRRSNICAKSGRHFEDEERFYTCIFEDPESDGYLRRDYSVDAWDEVKGELQPFSFWLTTYKAPVPENKPEVIEKESAETMLRRMIDEDEPHTENARYILALMLERKKTLKPMDTKETEGRKMLFYEHRLTGDVYMVADPQLRLDEVEKVQEEVSELLAGRSAQAAAEVEAAAAARAAEAEAAAQAGAAEADSASDAVTSSVGAAAETDIPATSISMEGEAEAARMAWWKKRRKMRRRLRRRRR